MTVLKFPQPHFADEAPAYVPVASIIYWQQRMVGTGSVLFLTDGIQIETTLEPKQIEVLVEGAQV